MRRQNTVILNQDELKSVIAEHLRSLDVSARHADDVSVRLDISNGIYSAEVTWSSAFDPKGEAQAAETLLMEEIANRGEDLPINAPSNVDEGNSTIERAMLRPAAGAREGVK